MTDPLLLPVLVRMATAATVVVGASLAAERAGPFWGGIVVSLPVSAGPAYVLLSMQQDSSFIAASALSSLASFPATAAFLLAYHRLAPRFGTIVTALAALAVWLMVVTVLRVVPWTPLLAVAVTSASFALGVWLTPPAPRREGPAPSAGKQWFDLPLRAVAVAVLVATVVTFSGFLGPGVVGIAAIAPVASVSLGVTVQSRLGGEITAATMAATLRSMPGIACGFLVLHFAAVPLGSPIGLTVALVASLIWPVILISLRARAAKAS